MIQMIRNEIMDKINIIERCVRTIDTNISNTFWIIRQCLNNAFIFYLR